MTLDPIPGQLNNEERGILAKAILEAVTKPEVVLEVGTWLGGGSTLHFLAALEANRQGHLWGIEADRSIYEAMIANLKAAAPQALHRFTPLFGFSQNVIPEFLSILGEKPKVDIIFLDGGDNPMEQINEFKLLEKHIPVGGVLLAHDINLRKGKWLRPYLILLDNWQVTVHQVSAEGLLEAVKLSQHPSSTSLRKARRRLFVLRLNPVELLGRILPQRVCHLLLQIMPRKLRQRVSQGR